MHILAGSHFKASAIPPNRAKHVEKMLAALACVHLANQPASHLVHMSLPGWRSILSDLTRLCTMFAVSCYRPCLGENTTWGTARLAPRCYLPVLRMRSASGPLPTTGPGARNGPWPNLRIESPDLSSPWSPESVWDMRVRNRTLCHAELRRRGQDTAD